MEEKLMEKKVLYDLLLGMTLADHMGDAWYYVDIALKEIGDEELMNADHEYKEQDGEEEGDGMSEFTRILRKRGAKYNYEKP